jgi:hypothetical protein
MADGAERCRTRVASFRARNENVAALAESSTYCSTMPKIAITTKLLILSIIQEALMYTRLLAFFVLLLANLDAHAAFQVQYSFAGRPGDQLTTPATTITDPNITAGDIVRGSGITRTAGANSMNSFGWTLDPSSPDLNDYYAFTLSATGGNTFSLTSLQYGDQRSDTGPRDFVIRTSQDGFTTDVFSYGFSSAGNESFTFDSSFSGLSAIEIRIYGYNAVDAVGEYRLNGGVGDGAPGALIVTGDIQPDANPVPAPASFGLFALGAPALWLVRRRFAK